MKYRNGMICGFRGDRTELVENKSRRGKFPRLLWWNRIVASSPRRHGWTITPSHDLEQDLSARRRAGVCLRRQQAMLSGAAPGAGRPTWNRSAIPCRA
jgi:hypothetical protein